MPARTPDGTDTQLPPPCNFSSSNALNFFLSCVPTWELRPYNEAAPGSTGAQPGFPPPPDPEQNLSRRTSRPPPAPGAPGPPLPAPLLPRSCRPAASGRRVGAGAGRALRTAAEEPAVPGGSSSGVAERS